jgi:hypothetical protein
MLKAGYPCITNPSATVPEGTVRLACLIHAVSIQSEPRSNSHRKKTLENMSWFVFFQNSNIEFRIYFSVTGKPVHTSSIVYRLLSCKQGSKHLACTLSLLYCQNRLAKALRHSLFSWLGYFRTNFVRRWNNNTKYMRFNATSFCIFS